MAELIILVDRSNKEIGTAEKLEAHQKDLLHRAFSTYIVNDNGEMLIQKRNRNKYHSGGLWSNACCSHPRVGEKVEEAIHRRLVEEMGFDTELKEIFTTMYKTEFSNGLHENEFLHVILGKYSGEVKANPEEAEEWKWLSIEELKKGIKANPDNYSYWFKKCFERVVSNISYTSCLTQ